MRVCVYASSSPKTSSAFVAQGRRLGRLLAERGHVLINGGGRYGGMGALNEGCRAAGGVIECVIHEMFVVDEGEFEGSDSSSFVEETTSASASALVERCDAIIVLPGGLGTLDEMLDAAALSQLGMPSLRPVVAVNVDGHYDHTLQQLERARREACCRRSPPTSWLVCRTSTRPWPGARRMPARSGAPGPWRGRGGRRATGGSSRRASGRAPAGLGAGEVGSCSTSQCSSARTGSPSRRPGANVGCDYSSFETTHLLTRKDAQSATRRCGGC